MVLNSRRSFVIGAVLFIVTTSICGADTRNAREWYRLGAEALAEDEYFAAVDSFRAAIRLNPAYAEARLGMAETLYLLEEYSDAYDEIIDARTYTFGDRRQLLLEARILTALGRYQDAIDLYNELLEGRPHDSDANRGLGEIYAILGQRELADEAYERSLQYSPGNLRVLLQLVILHDRSRERDLAENALVEALTLYPDDLHTRIQAAEHFALYDDWDTASDHLDRAISMLRGPEDGRYRRVARINATLALRRGDPAAAVAALESIPGAADGENLFLLARAYRELGDEEKTQNLLRLLLSLNPEDEITRIFREAPLAQSIGGLENFRREAAQWHIENGRRQEAAYYYDRALSSYRRARRIDSTNADIWLTYANIIRLKGYPLKYRDELSAAIIELDANPTQQAVVQERLELLRHSDSGSLAGKWEIGESWEAADTAWKIAVFLIDEEQSLIKHVGAEASVASFFADLLDAESEAHVVNTNGGFFPEVRIVNSYIDAFRLARESVDYFAILKFSETDRSFAAEASVYLGRSGEEVLRGSQIRTGQGKVLDALNLLSHDIASGLPGKATVLAVEDDKVLVDKGRWHGIEEGEPLVVLRRNSGRPALNESGIEYADNDLLGTLEISEISESLSEGKFSRAGDFEFLSPGDEVFSIPVPEISDTRPIPDPAFRSRLLAVP